MRSPDVLRTALALLADLLRLLWLMVRSRGQLAAENLFLRKQLACYIERRVRPRRTDNASRIAFALLSRAVEWRELLTIVRHTWGEERIAAELRVKLGLTLSPRTVSRYMPSRPRSRGGRSAQSWATFLHNHAGVVLASDFFIVVTATFQRLYVFVMLDIGTRRVVHWNLTDHPTAAWTTQQFRNGLPLDNSYRFLVHDRDGIFAPVVDEALQSMSRQVLKTPVRAPQANAHCERFIGTVRTECLDWMIPLNERHLRSALAEWMSHYNSERPHSALVPGLPENPTCPTTLAGHRLPAAHRIVVSPRLGGLHHHYQLVPVAA